MGWECSGLARLFVSALSYSTSKLGSDDNLMLSIQLWQGLNITASQCGKCNRSSEENYVVVKRAQIKFFSKIVTHSNTLNFVSPKEVATGF